MFHKASSVSDAAFRRLAQTVDLELLARVARADFLGRTGGVDCSAMMVSRSGPRPAVYERRLDGEVRTVDEAIAAARTLIPAEGPSADRS
jgi:hypothetical protein